MFYLLTFAVSWLLWVPLLAWLRAEGRIGAAASDQPLRGIPWWVGVSWFVGASAPSLVGVALTARSGGREAVGDLLARLAEVDVGIGWNAVAWLGPVAVGLAAVAIHVALGGERLRLVPKRFAVLPVALVAALPFGPLGEELGWRGYALPDLLARHGALASALVVGIVWTLWHVPVFWAPLGTTISGSPVTFAAVGRFFLEVTAISVVMTWLFVETGGSLWIAVGFHASWNAGLHRFFFAPLSDAATARVERVILALFLVIAVLLALWPGLGWRAG